jgi:hypothetical protein
MIFNIIIIMDISHCDTADFYNDDGNSVCSSDSGEILYNSIIYDPALADCTLQNSENSNVEDSNVEDFTLTQNSAAVEEPAAVEESATVEDFTLTQPDSLSPSFETQESSQPLEDNLELKPRDEAPPLTTTSYFVVSDRYGFVAAFSSELLLRYEMNKFYLIPYIIQKFEADQNCPLNYIWVVLYRELDAIAFVSNNRDEAVKFQKLYNSIGLSYDDDIDYWKQQVNVITPLALERLSQMSEAHKNYIPSDVPYLDSFNKITDESVLNIFEYVKIYTSAENDVVAATSAENDVVAATSANES